MALTVSRISEVSFEAQRKRPQVSHKVSEYVLSYINETILKPNRLLQSERFCYEFVLSISFPIPRPNRILYTSPFATETRLYLPQKGFRTVDYVGKSAFLRCIADDIDQSIRPGEYASVVFNMIADFLLYNYRTVSKETFDNLRAGMDISKIEYYPFPASIAEQQYIGDRSLTIGQ